MALTMRVWRACPARRPIYGLIFLFKWQKDDGKQARPNVVPEEQCPGVFFAKQVRPAQKRAQRGNERRAQVISNACATQAIVSILMNATGIDLGPELSNYKSFTAGLPSDVRRFPLSARAALSCSCDRVVEGPGAGRQLLDP